MAIFHLDLSYLIYDSLSIQDYTLQYSTEHRDTTRRYLYFTEHSLKYHVPSIPASYLYLLTIPCSQVAWPEPMNKEPKKSR